MFTLDCGLKHVFFVSIEYLNSFVRILKEIINVYSDDSFPMKNI